MQRARCLRNCNIDAREVLSTNAALILDEIFKAHLMNRAGSDVIDERIAYVALAIAKTDIPLAASYQDPQSGVCPGPHHCECRLGVQTA